VAARGRPARSLADAETLLPRHEGANLGIMTQEPEPVGGRGAGDALRYFSRTDEGHHAWGNPLYWLEVNEAGHAERVIAEYPSGRVVSYDRTHTADAYGALPVMVVDGDEDGWAPFAISREEFEARWRSHRPSNRRRPPD
jgi:hypothetical protein